MTQIELPAEKCVLVIEPDLKQSISKVKTFEYIIASMLVWPQTWENAFLYSIMTSCTHRLKQGAIHLQLDSKGHHEIIYTSYCTN